MVPSPMSPPEMVRLFSLKRVLGNTCFPISAIFVSSTDWHSGGHDGSQVPGESRLSGKESHVATALSSAGPALGADWLD